LKPYLIGLPDVWNFTWLEYDPNSFTTYDYKIEEKEHGKETGEHRVKDIKE